MKFKPGDRVYWISAPEYSEDMPDTACLIGVEGIVHSNVSLGVGYMVKFPNEDFRHGFRDHELEHALVYNSPLYKALL